MTMKTAEHIPQTQGRTPAHSVMAAVGNTPLIELKRIAAEVAPVRLFAKAEWFNPGGSVKDRPALNMLLDGERRGALTPDKIILDATSGNTGIAYAMFGAAMGYRVKLCLPANAGALHKRILRAYGAEIIETAAAEASDGAIRKAIELYEQSPGDYFYPDQYNNDANWQAHYNTTAVEIWEQTGGAITHFVAGLGTSGTFTGNTRRLREFNPAIQCISVQPDTPLHALEGWKHMPTSIQPGFYDEKLADRNIEVRTEDAEAMIKRLAMEEGLLVSPSSAAAVASALAVARGLDEGVVVTIMADNASKYLDHMNI
jgi:cysteine synthase B